MNMIKTYLKELYPDCYEALAVKVETLIADWKTKIQVSYPKVRKEDIMLITYGDGIRRKGEKPLQTLRQFLKNELEGTVNCVHLLPMFPYTSDDGFAVTDFREINPDLGDWEEIARLRENYDLMYDAVINHVSRSSSYFQEYAKGNPYYQNFFIECDPEADYSSVIRPRALPLLTEYETEMGRKVLWTTFSEDQLDLNFKSPEVLLEILDVLLLYVAKGARFIRFDAIGFAWKELGTTCMHLPQTHKLIKLMRAVLEECAEGITIITETNVPHKDNISYFGNGHDEAGMVYQFPLPPLTLYSYLSGDATYLLNWAETIEEVSEDVTYFNFLASHDGIGVRPVEDILNNEQRHLMEEETLKRGGKISYRFLPDGSKVPYELNINYLDAIAGDETDQELMVRKFMGSQCILLSVMGMPAIYYHSLVGSRNCYQDYEESGINRRINREKLDADAVAAELHDPSSLRAQVLEAYRSLLAVRKKEQAFAPDSPQKIVRLDKRVVSFFRGEGEDRVLVLVNVSGKKFTIDIGVTGCELLSGRRVEGSVEVGAYNYLWIKVDI